MSDTVVLSRKTVLGSSISSEKWFQLTPHIHLWLLQDIAKAFWGTDCIIIWIWYGYLKDSGYTTKWTHMRIIQACREHIYFTHWSVHLVSAIRGNLNEYYLRKPFGFPRFRPQKSRVLSLPQHATSLCGMHQCGHHVDNLLPLWVNVSAVYVCVGVCETGMTVGCVSLLCSLLWKLMGFPTEDVRNDPGKWFVCVYVCEREKER